MLTLETRKKKRFQYFFDKIINLCALYMLYVYNDIKKIYILKLLKSRHCFHNINIECVLYISINTDTKYEILK